MKMQIKITKREETPIKMDKMQKYKNTSCWRGCKEQKIRSLLLGIQNGTANLKDSLSVSNKTKIVLTYDLAITFL